MTYVDIAGREFEQPANIVVLCAYAQHNVHLLLLSGIGKPYDPKASYGVVGRNYAYQITSSVDVFVDELINPFMGAGALGQVVDDFNGDNFDHGPHGLHRRRLPRAVDDRRPPDPAEPRSGRHPDLGVEVEAARWRRTTCTASASRRMAA